MYLIVIVAMIVVVGAMSMDAMYGWRKAKERNEANAMFWEPGQIHHFNTKNMLTEPQHQEPS